MRTTPNDFNQYFKELKHRLVNQDYKPELIKTKHKNNRKTERNKLLKEKTSRSEKKQKIY